MARLRVIAAGAVVVLAACGQEANQQQAAPVEQVEEKPTAIERLSSNPSHNALAAMSEGERRRILRKLMETSGERCGTVTRTFYQGSTNEGQAFWDVECSSGGAWMVSIMPDSSTAFVGCEIKARLRDPCWEKF